ncbi:MAG: D-alanine--D-alanine ligase [Crocinitomicaceae bacterium]|nr:D-alanine--D-alanine ligase [Crocinitomicaceae bacterium]
MRNIGVICGGFSSEREVSLKSAKNIYNSIDKNLFTPYLIRLDPDGFKCIFLDSDIELDVDMNDFSFNADGRVQINCAIITVHGTPGEDGKIQGYFDIIGLPYINSGALPSALSFNKWFCNKTLSAFGIQIAPSLVIRKGEGYQAKTIIDKLGLPIFVKPTNAGSSFGISKVTEESQLLGAIEFGFKEGDELILEAFIKGRELTCGVVKTEDKPYALPITEIITSNDFFDYNAKYNGESNEVTPADISNDLKEKIQRTAEEVYDILQLSGLARIDFIAMDNQPYLIEVNTTPGMSDASIIPQMIAKDNKKFSDILTALLRKKL